MCYTLMMPPIPISRSEVEQYLQEGKTPQEIADLKGCHVGTVHRRLREWGLRAQKRRDPRLFFSPEQEEIVRDLYVNQGLSTAQVGERMGTDQSVAFSTLKRLGVKMRPTGGVRQYRLDESYFDQIDTEQKAYFLGLLYADGSMCHMHEKDFTRWTTTLSLHEEDGYMVEALRDAVHPERDRPVYQTRNQVRLIINSQRILEALGRLGCVERKSFILQFPTSEQVPNHLLRHFIRGYFDGDGCITWNHKVNHIQASFGLVGSQPFCEGVAEKLSPLVGPIQTHICKHSPNIYYATAGKQSTLRSIYHYLYDEATIFLRRKREKYDRLMTRLEQRVAYWSARGTRTI